MPPGRRTIRQERESPGTYDVTGLLISSGGRELSLQAGHPPTTPPCRHRSGATSFDPIPMPPPRPWQKRHLLSVVGRRSARSAKRFRDDVVRFAPTMLAFRARCFVASVTVAAVSTTPFAAESTSLSVLSNRRCSNGSPLSGLAASIRFGSRMKIACVDCSASARLELQHLLESAIAAGRHTIGHVPLGDIECRSPRELTLAPVPELTVTGPGLALDEIRELSVALRRRRSEAPLIAIRRAEEQTLDVLRKLESWSIEPLFEGAAPALLLHSMLRRLQSAPDRRSQIIVISGVKGGVGATTLTAALAHAAIEAGRRPLLIDLSAHSGLLHDMGAPRTHSSEYAALLGQRTSFDAAACSRFVTTAPCRIDLLLPPAGSGEVRDRWLRETHALERTFELLEALSASYDLVLVDRAHAEGLLPYALACRAEAVLLVTSNDAASIYRSIRHVQELDGLSRHPRTLVALTMLTETGLSANDAAGFLGARLSGHSNAPSELFIVPDERRARTWAGTGSTMYAQSSKSSRARVRALLGMLMAAEERCVREPPALRNAFFARARRRSFTAIPFNASPLNSGSAIQPPFTLEATPALVPSVAREPDGANHGRSLFTPATRIDPSTANFHGAVR